MKITLPAVFLAAFLPILYAYSGSGKIERKNDPFLIDTAVIRLPPDFQLYKPSGHPIHDTIFSVMNEPKKKIVTYVNVSCSSCLVELAEWAKLATAFAKSNVSVIMVLYSKDNFQYFKYLCEQGSIPAFNIPFILDIKNEFVRYNSSSQDLIAGIPCLVDERNGIILSGDPLHSEKMRDIFMNAITAGK
jgi:hypothetical protein